VREFLFVALPLAMAFAIASWCSGLRSEPSRVFSGAPMFIQASISRPSVASSDGCRATASAGASSAHVYAKGQFSSAQLRRTIG
jgi:hypothetical protein